MAKNASGIRRSRRPICCRVSTRWSTCYDRGDALLSEDSVRGDGFLADVVADWEAATDAAAEAGLRVVRMRSGRQWLSWIGIDDLTDIYYRVLYDDGLAGAVNAVGPEPVRNSGYTEALAAVLRRPALLPVPSFGSKLLLGSEGVRELAEANQRVLPTKLLRLGHRFRHTEVCDALAHQLGHD